MLNFYLPHVRDIWDVIVLLILLFCIPFLVGIPIRLILIYLPPKRTKEKNKVK